MEINKIGGDFFADNASGLSKDYDFNKDGTVNIEDYRLAIIKLNDDDPDNDVSLSKEQLDEIFANVISTVKEAQGNTGEITEENAEAKAQELLDEVKDGIADPTLAKSFAELQATGEKLSRYIKQCSELLPILNAKLEAMQKELDEIQEEKDVKEKEYKDVESEVNNKSTQLTAKITEVASRSETINQKMQANASTVIAKCIDDYKNGEYPGQNLYDVITQQLGENSGENTLVTALRSAIDECGSLGAEIKGLCTEIEGIVGNIRTITQKFNDKTNALNTLKTTRNGVLDASTDAAAQYQKGYQKRLDLRQEVIDKYYVAGNGTRDISNPQLDKISEFLNNNELENLPFADAYAILQGIAGECGISYSKGDITMPRFTYMKSESEITEGERSAMQVYNRLAAALKSRYGTGEGSGSEGTCDEYLTSGEPTCLGKCIESTCCDPITFKSNGQSFHFISDNNRNGVFDDASEFLGAQNGWDEMMAYDTDGDGKISGSELDKLQLVSQNEENGQFTFMNAKEAGIKEIDLSTYNDTEEKKVNGDVLQGTFEIKMNDGSVVNAEHTDDDTKNIEMNYANLFGANIEDKTDDYKDNPFMDLFVETTDTKKVVNDSESSIQATSNSIESKIYLGNAETHNKIDDESNKAVKEKDLADEEASQKAQQEENKNPDKKYKK